MNVTFSVDSDAVGWVVFDTPGSRANVFDQATQQALGDAIDAFEASTARAIVVAGAKERIFIAGADLHWLQSLGNRATAETFSRKGQLLFQRIAQSRVPVVCAIHGACAGGGFELALACDWRIATTAPATQIGLPETSIGTIPGWGGCVRLPRLIGVENALDHILRGQLIGSVDALHAGLVDEVVAPEQWRAHTKAVALKLAGEGRPSRPSPPLPNAENIEALRQRTIAKSQGHQPALLAAIEAVTACAGKPVEEALGEEARFFAEVSAGDVCRNMIHAFFLRDAAKKRTLDGWLTGREPGVECGPIRRIGVVGAGVMGSGIAHWLAMRGFEVLLRDVRVELLDRAMGVIRSLLEEGVRRGKTTAQQSEVVLGRIRTTTSWDGFSDCDLVVEAIVENVAAKRTLFSELAGIVRDTALLASNTSALPIEELAGHIPNPGRTLGIHFFNPVSRMPLVELILARQTSAAAANRALELVRGMGKSPVICRSSPGFVVTRVLFFYLNDAVALWQEGVSTEQIDSAMRGFGWPMGPMRLIDEVGVDVTAFIFSEMKQYFPNRFSATAACQCLLDAGLNGRKNGASRGFYVYSKGQELANEIEARNVVKTDAAAGGGGVVLEGDAIVARLMNTMTEEARRCLEEKVVLSPDDIDFALLSGAGFPAFSGGLLRWADAKRL